MASDEHVLISLGNSIRTRRRALDWSQEELAERAGISSVYLSRVERGRAQPSFVVLNKIANALGIKLLLSPDNHKDSLKKICEIINEMRSLNDALCEELEKIGILSPK